MTRIAFVVLCACLCGCEFQRQPVPADVPDVAQKTAGDAAVDTATQGTPRGLLDLATGPTETADAGPVQEDVEPAVDVVDGAPELASPNDTTLLVPDAADQVGVGEVGAEDAGVGPDSVPDLSSGADLQDGLALAVTSTVPCTVAVADAGTSDVAMVDVALDATQAFAPGCLEKQPYTTVTKPPQLTGTACSDCPPGLPCPACGKDHDCVGFTCSAKGQCLATYAAPIAACTYVSTCYSSLPGLPGQCTGDGKCFSLQQPCVWYKDTSGCPMQCTDGDAGTADLCTKSGCVQVPIACDDGNPCTLDTLDPCVGCKHEPSAGPCWTVLGGCGTCNAGTCQAPDKPVLWQAMLPPGVQGLDAVPLLGGQRFVIGWQACKTTGFAWVGTVTPGGQWVWQKWVSGSVRVLATLPNGTILLVAKPPDTWSPLGPVVGLAIDATNGVIQDYGKPMNANFDLVFARPDGLLCDWKQCWTQSGVAIEHGWLAYGAPTLAVWSEPWLVHATTYQGDFVPAWAAGAASQKPLVSVTWWDTKQQKVATIDPFWPGLDAGPGIFRWANQLRIASKGQVLLAGAWSPGGYSHARGPWIWRLDAKAKTVWEAEFPAVNGDWQAQAVDALELPDGRVVAVGTWDKEGWIGWLGPSGQVLGSQRVGGVLASPRRLLPGPDGTFEALVADRLLRLAVPPVGKCP